MLVTLDAKRRLAVPRQIASVTPGDQFDVSFDSHDNAIVFRRVHAQDNWLDVVGQCPVSIDDLPRHKPSLPRKRRL